MSYTDPSGYFFVAHKAQQSFIKASVKVFSAEAVGIAGKLATIGCGIAAPVCAAHFNYNREMGASTSGSLRAGFTAAVSAYTFQQIRSMTDITQGTRVALHAFAGGITSELQGGKFGHGFISAGLTKAINVNGIIGASQASGMGTLRIVTATVIGGTISRITGGKFANGAITAAFEQAFNGEEQAKHEDALAELQKEVHEDANHRKDQIITRNGNWIDPSAFYGNVALGTNAQWISDSQNGASQGFTALYAIDFFNPFSDYLTGMLDFYWSVDNDLGASLFDNTGLYINGLAVSSSPTGGSFGNNTPALGLDIGSLLVAGTNTLYINARDFGGPGGLMFSARLTIDGANNPPTSVSAPSALLLIGLGFLGFVLSKRKKA